MSGQHQTEENLPGGKESGTAEVQIDMTPEARARRQGWRPEAEYRAKDGSKDGWVPAEEYLRRGEEQWPLLRQNNRKLETKVATLEAQQAVMLAEVQAANAQIAESRQVTVEIRGMLSSAEDRAYKRAVKELSARRDAAIEEGNAAEAKAAIAELDQVNEAVRERAATKTPEKKDDHVTPKPQVDPAANAWINAPEQAWYREIPGAKGWAEQMFVTIRDDPKTKGISIADNLKKIAAMAPDYFATKHPEYFDDRDPEPQPRPRTKKVEEESEPIPQRRSAVSQPRSPGAGNRGSNGQSFDDIPKGDQAKYYSQAKEIEAYGKSKGKDMKFTKEEFTQAYKEAGGFDNRE